MIRRQWTPIWRLCRGTSEKRSNGLRQLIKRTVRHVDERMSYGTTVMFSLGRDHVGFVSQRKHLSFFTASPKLARAMKRRDCLLEKILKARVSENAASTRT